MISVKHFMIAFLKTWPSGYLISWLKAPDGLAPGLFSDKTVLPGIPCCLWHIFTVTTPYLPFSLPCMPPPLFLYCINEESFIYNLNSNKSEHISLLSPVDQLEASYISDFPYIAIGKERTYVHCYKAVLIYDNVRSSVYSSECLISWVPAGFLTDTLQYKHINMYQNNCK